MTTTKKRPTPTQLRLAFSRATKLSQILRLALHDLKLVERNRRYEVDMGTWVSRSRDGKCNVCLAGAVMVSRFRIGVKCFDYNCTPANLGEDSTAQKLRALNALRTGSIRQALYEIGTPTWTLLQDVPPGRRVCQYEENKVDWWKSMRQLLKDLRAAGL